MPTDQTFHDFNSFQRVLRMKNIDGPHAVVLTEMYVQMLSLSQQLDQAASILVSLTETISNFTELHSATQTKVQALYKEMHPNEVYSEMVHEDDYKQ